MHVPGPYQEKAKQIYDELRSNIIKNVFAVRFIIDFPDFRSVCLKYTQLAFCFYRNTSVLDLSGNNTLHSMAKESAAIRLLVGPVPCCLLWPRNTRPRIPQTMLKPQKQIKNDMCSLYGH